MAESSCAPKQIYDVFVSFRGEDTRNDFAGHFYAALCWKKVNAYLDEDRLEKGDEILSALSKAIEESKISVVIFSQNYASSSWCLNELVHILHCQEVNKQLVVLIFYHVDPSDIRHQRNSYAVAFAGHEERFDGEKVQLWRNALKDAGNMCGWHISVTRELNSLQKSSFALVMAASSSALKQIYDVFISFRGEDTRSNFTGHFYAALCRKNIYAYLDEDRLEKGDEISSALLKAIESSKISIVIFSENYASSSWCLSELAHILHCREVNNQLVIPIFYHVDPSDIRHQTNSYAVAFAGHEKRLEDDKVQLWRNALKEACNLGGWHISVTSSESKEVEKIVKDIIRKLENIVSKEDFEDLVGIDKRVQNIGRLLHLSSLDVRIVGIWGMGGIGKTTLAKVVFNHFAPLFQSCCFLENIKSKRHNFGEVQKKLFSELLMEKIKNVNQFVKDRLKRMKVLIVFDDVDDEDQLETFSIDHRWFGHGSRIIITTRDRQLLNNARADEVYEVEELNVGEALQLFYANAFQGKSPSPIYEEMSKEVVTRYAKGVPLALKILGCHLCSRSCEEWESELEKLEIIPHDKVQTVLKTSYNGLSDNEKKIFLDIACFFTGMKLDVAKSILDSCHFGVAMGIRILIDKSLISIDRANTLSMHDLVHNMGIEIVRQQSPDEPGKRSRLWSVEDVCHVLKNNAGTPKIQGMSMDMSKISAAICLRPRVFKKMYNLKFLKFHGHRVDGKLHFPDGLEYLPDVLRYLHWDSFPLASLPQKFWPQNLVELHLNNSKLSKLWDGIQHIESLKFLNLKESENLTEIPDLSRALNLNKIHLSGCIRLKHLPSTIDKLESLQFLSLFGCSNVDEFPELPKNITHLVMAETAIENVPPSIDHLSHLLLFDLRDCKRLKSLPANFFKLKSLEGLLLKGCLGLEHLPEILEPMEHLTVFETQETGIRCLPLSIENLVRIRNLELQNTSVSEIPDWLFRLPALQTLDLSRTNIIRIPKCVKLSKLQYLWISDCKFLQYLPELPLSIKKVDARGCTSLDMVLNSWSLLAQGPKRDLCFHELLSFEGCSMLDNKNISTEFQIRVFSIASILVLLRHKDWLKLDHKKIVTKVEVARWHNSAKKLVPEHKRSGNMAPFEVLICYSGDEIPEWFRYRNVGCSINMKLSPLLHRPHNFMGFAFCFVVENAHNADLGEWVYLNWEIRVQTNNNDERRLQFVSGLSCFGGDYDLNQVLMATYLNTDEVNFDSVIEMSFHFSFVDSLEHKIQRCGVRMLYLQDAIEFGIIAEQYVFEKLNVVSNEPQPSGFWKNMLYHVLDFQVFPSRQQLCEKLLSSKIPKRQKDLWLLLVWDFLPVREVLNRHMDVADTTCPLCGVVLESATHLFLYCQSVRPLWFMSQWGLRTDFLLFDSMASFLEVLLFGDPNSDMYHFDREFLLYASMLVDTIWLARNELVHNEKVFHTADIHASVQAQFNHIMQAKREIKAKDRN